MSEKEKRGREEREIDRNRKKNENGISLKK